MGGAAVGDGMQDMIAGRPVPDLSGAARLGAQDHAFHDRLGTWSEAQRLLNDLDVDTVLDATYWETTKMLSECFATVPMLDLSMRGALRELVSGMDLEWHVRSKLRSMKGAGSEEKWAVAFDALVKKLDDIGE
jgi:hypothetical protein